MSLDQEAEPPQEQGDVDMDAPSNEQGPKASHKSFRRKYRKMMVKFEDTMRESVALFKEEQRILDISQRLAEQNDQILELLSELNTCPQIPLALRYDLTASNKTDDPAGNNARPFDPLGAQSTLQTARQRLRNGDLKLAEYRKLEETIVDSPALVPAKSYTSLLKVPHNVPTSRHENSQEFSNATTNGVLNIAQEEQYLAGIDSYLNGKSMTTRPHAVSNLGSRTAEKTTDRERELQLRNPVSVYNWLRKHQPQVFLQDNESQAEKQTRPQGSRISKRASASHNVSIKQEQDLYDDDGIAVDASHGGKGKRKRDDDPGYRPKGGNSRPSKRKKEDVPPAVKRPKKQSISARSEGDFA